MISEIAGQVCTSITNKFLFLFLFFVVSMCYHVPRLLGTLVVIRRNIKVVWFSFTWYLRILKFQCLLVICVLSFENFLLISVFNFFFMSNVHFYFSDVGWIHPPLRWRSGRHCLRGKIWVRCVCRGATHFKCLMALKTKWK